MICKQKNNLNNNDLELRIIIGEKCNLSCTYCTTGKMDNEFKNFKELNLFIKRLKFENLIIEFMGGEALFYINNITEILLNIEKIEKNITVKIITNGTLLDNKNIQNRLLFLRKKFTLGIMVSIHNEIPIGLEWLKDNKFNYYTSKPIHTNNEILDNKINDIFPTFFNYEGLKYTENYTKEILLDDKLINLYELYKSTNLNFKGWNCKSGLKLICIDVDGLVYPCPMLLIKKINGVTMEKFIQQETICELEECWEFTSERIKYENNKLKE